MSITLNKSKTIHPNRLVTRHEEFLVNKNLANKVTHVKSTIKSGNKHFEDILNRRKKEHGRSSLQNADNYAPEFSSNVADDLRIKTSDAQTRNARLIDPYFLPAARKLHSSTERKTYETFMGSPNTSLANSKQSTMTNLHRYNSPKYLSNVGIERNYENDSDLPPVKQEDLLKEKLMEKSKEIEYLKNELKEWWHEDFKEVKGGAPKISGAEKLAPLSESKPMPKTLRKTFSLKEEFSRSENNNLASNVPQTVSSNNERQNDRVVKVKEGFIIKKSHVTFSTTSKAKSSSEDAKASQDKSDESQKRIPVKTILKRLENKERPSTVKNTSAINNQEFKVRLSHNAASIANAKNTRYDDNSGFEQIQEVEENNSDSNVFSSRDINNLKDSQKSQKSQGSSGKKSTSKFFSASQENVKTDFKQALDDMPKDDSVLIGEPSPQIYPTSKTLARQSKDLAIARKEKDFQMSEEMILYGSVQNEFEKELAQEPEAALDRESVEDPPEYYNKLSNSMQVSDEMKKQAAPAPQNTEYQIKPKQREKFKPAKTKDIIQEIMNNTLKDKQYSHDKAQEYSRYIADEVKNRLKTMNLPRYKFLVQVTVGEQKGQGVRVGTKCFWDFDTDYCTSEVFQNDYLFCLCVVYAVYLY